MSGRDSQRSRAAQHESNALGAATASQHLGVDPIEAYDALALAGEAPDPAVYCAALPVDAQQDVLHKLEILRSVRRLLPDLLAAPQATDAPLTPPPRELDGFTLVRPLGRGGMGQVYLARQTVPARLCALKLLRADLAMSVTRLEREANLAAGLHHPNIAAVYAARVADGHAYIAMELVHGFSLRQLLRASSARRDDWLVDTLRQVGEGPGMDAGHPMPVDVALDIAIQTADALGEAHARGIVHRDVKPANMMVTWSMQVKLIDFGLARLFEGAPGDTQSGMFVGTWDYAAPEQLRADLQAVGPWSDTYALGVTLYEMLTQRLPHGAVDFAERVAQVDAPPPAVRVLRPEVSRALDTLLRRALSPDPDARFRDGAQMADALRACITASASPGLPSLSLAPAPSRGRGWLSHVVWACALVGALGWGWREHATAERIEAEARAAILRHEEAYAQHMAAGKVTALKQCFVATRKTLQFTPAVLPPRLEVALTIASGRVTQAQPSSFSRHLNAEAKACMAQALVGLEVPGLGMRKPVVLDVGVELPGVGTADDPARQVP